MKFEIENLKQWDNGDASFTVKTEGGMYYDCKYVANGGFVVSGQSRKYTKKDGTNGYTNAFGAIKGSPAAKFFDDVASQVSGMIGVERTFNQDDDNIPF